MIGLFSLAYSRSLSRANSSTLEGFSYLSVPSNFPPNAPRATNPGLRSWTFVWRPHTTLNSRYLHIHHFSSLSDPVPRPKQGPPRVWFQRQTEQANLSHLQHLFTGTLKQLRHQSVQSFGCVPAPYWPTLQAAEDLGA